MGQTLKTYSAKERNMYLLGMVGQNIVYSIVSGSLAYYLQFTILIPAIAVSVIMAAARVWDAVNDPMMGTIVDRTRTKIGKCRPYLLAVPFPIFAMTVLCFLNLGFFDTSKGIFEGHNALIVLWAAVTYILWGMVYTVGDIPLWGITALMSEDDSDRAKLLSLAQIAGGIGGGIAVLTVQPAALELGKNLKHLFTSTASASAAAAGERMGFIATAAGFGLAGCELMQLVGIFSRERIPPSKEKHTLKENFALMWTNKPFRQILLSGLMGSPRYLLFLAAMPLISYYYSGKNPSMAFVYIVILGGGMFGGQFFAMAIAPRLLKRFKKKDLYNYSNLLSAIPFACIFLLYLSAPQQLTQPLYTAASFVLFALSGAANGLTTVLISFMIADAVDYEEYQNGIRPDAVFFSGQTFMVKLGTGIATLLSGIAYSMVGFSDAAVRELNDFIDRGGIPRLTEEYAPYMAVLFFLISVPPAVGGILSVIPTWHYSLSDEEHSDILVQLNRRRHGAQAEETGEILK